MGDDALTPSADRGRVDTALVESARRRFVAINGDHPMSPDDDAYVREHFVAADERSLRLMDDGLVPQAAYLLSDGTPMVPADHLDPLDWAGGVERLHGWFVAFWPDDPVAGEEEWTRYLSGHLACLGVGTPVRARQLAMRLRDAATAVATLRRDPHDPVGRGLLGQAVDGVTGVVGLDDLLLPMTAYDRLRFRGPTVRETWVDGPTREFLSPAPPTLPLRTERLVLRPFEPGDDAAFHDAWASEEWTSMLLSHPMNAAEVTDWVRRRRALDDPSFLGLVVEHEGRPVGNVLLVLQGTGLSEGELGWMVLPEHGGHGYGTESARALLEVAFRHYGLRRVVAELDARNDRSAALCERLGMRLESRTVGDFWSKGEWTSSLRYALLADEWRAAPD